MRTAKYQEHTDSLKTAGKRGMEHLKFMTRIGQKRKMVQRVPPGGHHLFCVLKQEQTFPKWPGSTGKKNDLGITYTHVW